MSAQDLHQVILRWPHTDANEVIVTGTFDQWSCSLRLFRKPDGFEAPVFIPWKDKIAYKFIVDGRWLTNDNEPTEVDHGFVNNVYTAPPKPPMPEPQPAIAPSSHHNESAVEPEHVEKVPGHADKPVVNGSALGEPHKLPVPTAGPAPEKSSTLPDEVKSLKSSIVNTAHVAVAQVAPDPREVERASDEVAPDVPKEPVHIAVSSPTQSNPEQEHSTHLPVHLDADAAAAAAEVEEPATASVSKPELEATPYVDASRVGGLVPAETGASPTSEAESKVVAGPEPVPEPEPAAASAAVEPLLAAKLEGAPTAAESKIVPAPEREVPVAPAREESVAIPEPSAPAPAVEQVSLLAKSTGLTRAVEPASVAAPEPETGVKSSEVPSSPSFTAPAVSGHAKSLSTASTSTTAPTLPTTPTRKASRKFSFAGRDKSVNSSPTGSSRFSSLQKREKRNSLLGKLKDIFSDKEKKERKEKSAKA